MNNELFQYVLERAAYAMDHAPLDIENNIAHIADMVHERYPNMTAEIANQVAILLYDQVSYVLTLRRELEKDGII
jgi:hypothetical protein